MGNGNSIRLGMDIWICDLTHFKTNSSLDYSLNNCVVANFINHVEGVWDEDALCDTLSPGEVEKILLIPLVRSQPQDLRR